MCWISPSLYTGGGTWHIWLWLNMVYTVFPKWHVLRGTLIINHGFKGYPIFRHTHVWVETEIWYPQILGVQNHIVSIEFAISGRISWIMGRTWEQNCELYLCPAIERWVWTQIPMQMCNMYCIPRIVSRIFLQETLSKLDGNQGFLLVLWAAYRCFAYPSPVVTLNAMSKICIHKKHFHKQNDELLYFVWSPPWHLYIF